MKAVEAKLDFYIGAALNVVAIIVWLRMRLDRPIGDQTDGFDVRAGVH